MKSQLLSRLGMTVPIIQAPMVGVSTARLAAAVSNAGGLGSIGAGASTAEQARAQIAEVRALTDKPFNLNLFCHQPAQADPLREAAWLAHLAPFFAELGAKAPTAIGEIYQSFVGDEAMLAMLLEEKPAVVSFHFGLPPQGAIDALKKAGITLLATATNLAEAKQIEAAGIDAIVAQGVEAGGHRGVFSPNEDDEIGTLALVRQLAQACQVPVMAAGGIMDGAGIRAAMALGAQGVQLGTAFILCPESAANDAYRAAMKSERALHTAITSNISGRPARGLPNRFYQPLDDLAPALPDYPIAYDAGKALVAAAKAAGSEDFAVQWAGQGAPLARALPAGELVRTLVREMSD
ncbi:NAD(P)H-dependent flavin oxidoreductase [Gallaecimonas xiamenensis]|uniref:Nitronate monooxygenase n=1 Tax=Gallaecimonas xiamenensis 3-C-1 TaxID=745411 RepID=K2JA44_9GAMM|nr:nitronate monooxygenase [Gallaecimonas xiamenensis]EKE71652.1 2-nitropropane dioxygenase [Gallaecimonas xiamenensis 3-C-1]